MTVVSLTAAQVREAVPMADAVAAGRQGFVDLAAGHFEMPTRTALRGTRHDWGEMTRKGFDQEA